MNNIPGTSSEEHYEFTEFPADDLPFEIGSLERAAFSKLGDWSRLKKENETFGFYYRVGVKEKIRDARGDLATCYLHFVVPFTKEGYLMTPQIQLEVEQRTRLMICLTARLMSEKLGNVLSVGVVPPPYMLEELVRMLPT